MARWRVDTPEGDQVDDPLAPPPADGEGGDVHLVEPGQTTERPGAEDTDTGRPAQQWGGVEGHGEPWVGRRNPRSSPGPRGR